MTTLALLGACERGDERDLVGPLDHITIDEREHVREVSEDPAPYVAPVDLELDWALDSTLIPAAHGAELLARIRVVAPAELGLPRPPARVVLVVDSSASMRGEAIEGAKRAATELVDSLAEGDSFSLVVFHSRAEVLMPATIIGPESRAAARAQIEKMQAWGTTDLAGGLQAALFELGKVPQSLAPVEPDTGLVGAGAGDPAWAGGDADAQLRRVVLLGDGVPNDPAPIAGITDQLVANGVEITALGYGLDYDEVLLASLAERSHGHFRFAEDPEAVAALFRDEVLHIDRTVARDLRLSMALGPGVQLLEVVGHSVQRDGEGRRVIGLGSITEGQTHELIVRLAVGPHRAGATVELSDLELAFTDVHTGTGARFERGFVAATASEDVAAIEAGRDRELVRAAARAQTSAATLDVLALARNGQLEQAQQRLRAAVKWAKLRATELGDADLASQAEQLAALEPELKGLARATLEVTNSAADGRPEPFPGQPSVAGSRAVKAAHSAAFNDLHE